MPRFRDAPEPTVSWSRRRLTFVLFGHGNVEWHEMECIDYALPTSAEAVAGGARVYRAGSRP